MTVEDRDEALEAAFEVVDFLLSLPVVCLDEALDAALESALEGVALLGPVDRRESLDITLDVALEEALEAGLPAFCTLVLSTDWYRDVRGERTGDDVRGVYILLESGVFSP